MAAPLTPASSSLARAARERFVAHLEGVLAPLGDAIRAQLAESVDSAGTTREMYDRRDAFLDFEQARQKWVEGTRSAWRRAVLPPTATARVRMDLQNLELIGDDVVENKILSSRLAMAAQEKAVWDLNELKLRIQHLEGGDDLASDDVLRPEAVAQILVEQWAGAGLKRDAWTLVKDLIHARVAERMVEAYHRTNEFLVSQGVLRDIDLSARVKRPPAAGRRAAGAAGGESGPGGLASQPGGMAGADD